MEEDCWWSETVAGDPGILVLISFDQYLRRKICVSVGPISRLNKIVARISVWTPCKWTYFFYLNGSQLRHFYLWFISSLDDMRIRIIYIMVKKTSSFKDGEFVFWAPFEVIFTISDGRNFFVIWFFFVLSILSGTSHFEEL